ncbi:hypothetical protein [Sinomicrobium sp.]
MSNEYEENNEMLENEEVEDQQDGEEETPQEVDYEKYKALEEETQKMREYLRKANLEAKNYRIKAKQYEEAGFSPEELKELKEKEFQRQQKEMERKGDFNKLKETLAREFSEKEKQYQSRIEQLQSSMEKTLVQREVVSAIAKHEGIETLLQPHVERNVKLMENDDGTMVARVVDPDGSPRFNSRGDYMTVDEYVASLREHDDFGVAFRGRQQSGSGSRPAPTNGKQAIPKKPRSEMTQREREDFVNKFGWDAYHELPIS